jgi:hypothetical protein
LAAGLPPAHLAAVAAAAGFEYPGAQPPASPRGGGYVGMPGYAPPSDGSGGGNYGSGGPGAYMGGGGVRAENFGF